MQYVFNPFVGSLDAMPDDPLLPANGGTGLTALGSGIATWLGTPSSANLAAAVTGDTGSGALVFGTSPTFTTDLTTPLIYGGTGASGTLQLQSTSNSTRGTVNSVDRMLIATDALAFAATNGIVIDVGTGNISLTTGSVTALRFASTITMGGNTAVTVAALFNAAGTVIDDGTARTLKSALYFVSQMTYTATIAGGLVVQDIAGIPAYTSVYHGPVLNRTGAGTGTMATCAGLFIAGNVGVGWTVTNFDGMLITLPTIGGTVTTFSGIRSTVAAASGRFFLNDTGGAQSLLTGPLGCGVAPSSTTALICVAGTTAKSSLRIPHGAAPTAPVDGDIWTTTAGLFVRINGGTVGPLA